MGEYLPLFLPGASITKTTSANVVGGRPVYVSGNNTVANTTAGTQVVIGVAAFDCASGDRLMFFGRGTVHRLTAGGAITAGALVEAAADGEVVTLASGAAFGVALTTGSDGNPVEIMEF